MTYIRVMANFQFRTDVDLSDDPIQAHSQRLARVKARSDAEAGIVPDDDPELPPDLRIDSNDSPAVAFTKRLRRVKFDSDRRAGLR